jgi:transcriptional regulator with XRE-family HTH domain
MSSTDFQNVFAERLKTARKAAHCSGKKLSLALGKAENTVSSWETFAYQPSLDDVKRVSEILNVSVGYLFGEGDAAPPPTHGRTLEDLIRTIAREEIETVLPELLLRAGVMTGLENAADPKQPKPESDEQPLRKHPQSEVSGN